MERVVSSSFSRSRSLLSLPRVLMLPKTRSLRVFSPYLYPDSLAGLISICAGFNLEHSMRRAAREADLAEDNDDNTIPLDLSRPGPESPTVPDMSPLPTTSQILSSVTHIIDMRRGSVNSNTSEGSSASSSSPSTSSQASPGLSAPSSSSLSPESSSQPSSSSKRPSSPQPPSRTGKNKRTTNRRKRRRQEAWTTEHEPQDHPATREPLSFPGRLVKKFGTIDVKNLVTMKWFSVARLAHAAGAFIGLLSTDTTQVDGWTADDLQTERGFVLIKWDGLYVLDHFFSSIHSMG